MSKKHVSQLADFAPFTEPQALRVDLACGQRKLPGWTGIDIVPCAGVDIVHDLNIYPWPFEESSVAELRASHYVEHVPDLVKFMNECWRVLRPNGLFTIIAPHGGNLVRAWQDPTHVRPLFRETFDYFSQTWLKAQGLSHYPITCDFNVEGIRYMLDPHWAVRGDEAQQWARKHYVNVVVDFEIVLRAIKDIGGQYG